MPLIVEVEIHFIRANEAYVLSQTNAENRFFGFDQILVFCCLALEHLRGGGSSGPRKQMASMLTALDENSLLRLTLPPADGARLVERSVEATEKSFWAGLQFGSWDVRCDFAKKGFGLLSQEVDAYGAKTVSVFLQDLVRRRRGDDAFMARLRYAANSVGNSALTGKTSDSEVANHALYAAEGAFLAHATDMDLSAVGDSFEAATSRRLLGAWREVRDGVAAQVDANWRNYPLDLIRCARLITMIGPYLMIRDYESARVLLNKLLGYAQGVESTFASMSKRELSKVTPGTQEKYAAFRDSAKFFLRSMPM